MGSNKMRKIKIIIMCIIVSIVFSGCHEADSITEIKIYIANTNSMKVHDKNCASAKLISEKNRLEIIDTLSNICAKGYKICKNCRCGLSKKYVYLRYELPSRDEYLKAIDTMGEWYINHIPTYQTELEQEEIVDYENNQFYVKEYTLLNRYKKEKETKSQYLVLTNDLNGENLSIYEKDKLVLRGTENAVKYYKENYNNIKPFIPKDLYYYPCKYLEDSVGTYKKARRKRRIFCAGNTEGIYSCKRL